MKKNYTKEQYFEALKLRNHGIKPSIIAKTLNIKITALNVWLYQNKKPFDAFTEEEKENFRKKMSVTKIGEKNPRWKGDRVKPQTGNDRARRWFKAPEGFDRHHKDGNPLNNNPSNIEVTSRKGHMTVDGRLSKRDLLGRFTNC